MEPNRIVNSTTPIFQEMQGYSPRLYVLTSKPPGPWPRINPSTGEPEWYDLPAEGYSHGSVIGVEGQAADRSKYVKLYVYIDNPYDPSDTYENPLYYAWDHWKQIDLRWPKIDPDTARPMDQFRSWPAQ